MAADHSNCYQRNLAALTVAQPSIAAAVETTLVPDGVIPVRGRDDSETFLLPTADGRGAWLGGSSMPTVSAGEVWGGLRGDGRNLILPGVLTGLEPLLILERIPSMSALFVCEPSALHLKLALMLRDYRSYIESGQLVFIPGDGGAIVDELVRFFEQHTGYEVPVHLLPIPQQSAAQAAALQAHVENAARTIASIHAREIELSARRLLAMAGASTDETPRVAVVSSDPSPQTLEHARRLGRALDALSWKHVVALPHKPNECHMVARMRAVEQVRAQLVIMANLDGGRMRSALPDSIPMVYWSSPDACIMDAAQWVSLCAKFPTDRIVVCSSAQRKICCDAGLSEQSMIDANPSADAACFASAREGCSADSSAGTIVVLSDHPDDTANACGISQTSHVTLWEAMKAIAVRQLAETGDVDLDELLRRAQKESATKLREEDVRHHFREMARTNITPAATAHIVAESLESMACDYAMYGHHWPVMGAAVDRRQGAIPVGTELADVLRRTNVLVLPSFSALYVQAALDAMVARVRVVAKFPDPAFRDAYPTLQEVEPFINFYRTRRELLSFLRACMAEPQSSWREEARQVVLSSHTIEHRLRHCYQIMRTETSDAISDNAC